MNTAHLDANVIRRQTQTKLRAMRLDAIQKESSSIIRHLAQWNIVQTAEVIAAFYPMRSEPQIQPLLQSIASQKILLLPRVLPDGAMEFVHVRDIEQDTHPATFGLHEPRLALKAWKGASPELFLIPGVAFGRQGERIGHGGGYYDQYLAQNQQIPRIGIALSTQIWTQPLPQHKHDVRMNYIVSPIGIFATP